MSHLWAGDGVQVRYQDCHLPPKSLSRCYHDAGKACVQSPGSLLWFYTCSVFSSVGLWGKSANARNLYKPVKPDLVFNQLI